MKCIVKDCQNLEHQGKFIGSLCSPCHHFITTGEGKYSQAYRNTNREWIGLTDEEIIIMSRYDLEYAALIGEVQRKLKEKNTNA